MKTLPYLLAAALCSTAAVQAQVLIAGGSVSGPGLENQPALGGSFAQLPQLNVFNSGNLVGGVTSGVLTGDAANPHGGLTFLYSVANTGVDSVTALSVPGFGGLSLTVRESAGLGSVLPVAATRGATPGSDVNFFFGAPFTDIASGSGSSWILVHSDAATFGTASATVVGPSGSAPVNVYAPVPEPAEYAAVVGASLIGLAVWRRRNA